MGIDPLWAMVHKYGLRFLLIANGVSLHQANEIFKDAHLLSVVKGIYEPIKTSSLRRMGMRIDDVQINSLPALETYKDIGVPTYISHAVNDPLAPSKDAAYLASIIPNAKYHEWSDGGHLFFVVHSKHVIPNIERFLKANLKAI